MTDATIKKYDRDAVRQFRMKAAELGELRDQLATQVEAAHVDGDVVSLGALLREFTLRTKEFNALGETLGPAGVFVAKYGVEVHGQHVVSWVIPKGSSRLEILQEAQAIVTEQQLISPSALESLEMRWRCTEKFLASERFCINARVQGLDSKNLTDQEVLLVDRGLKLASCEDLAVAFAAFWIASGEPLFGWTQDPCNYKTFYVRGRGGTLYFQQGLRFRQDRGEPGWFYAAAARIEVDR